MNGPARLSIKGSFDLARAYAGETRFMAVLLCALLWLAFSGQAAETRTLGSHLPDDVRKLIPLGRLPSTNTLRLTIALPLRHQTELNKFLERLYDPGSPDFHKYLSPEQFTARFGPTTEDYQKVVRFACGGGLDVVKTHDSRIVLDVRGKTADVERAFHVKLHTYRHPTEARQFYAPDVEPTVDAALPIQEIYGLTDYAKLRPASRVKSGGGHPHHGAGSGPGGNYMGSDYSNAYLPGVSLTGTGQMVGLFEADGFFTNDILAYESLTGLPNVPLMTIPIDGFGGTPGSGNSEVALDIELAISMAPGLDAVVVFEGPDDVTYWLDILDSMASSNQIKQFSCSWGYTSGTDPNTNFDAVFQKMAAQGQSFFQAAGDGDAWVYPIWVPADSPYVTSVGGTSLTMTNSGAAYTSESVWNSGNEGYSWGANGSDNDDWGSGGGVSTVYSIPSWQQNPSLTGNLASTTMRNIPDVATVGDDVWVTYDNGSSNDFMGTSCAAPLWAGFMALVNEQAVTNGYSTVGFINPAIYAIGLSGNYSNCFHDITSGDDTWPGSPTNYYATPGYDLCTGWGSPMGVNLINALAPVDVLQITPAAGFTANGGVGGPFTATTESFVLTNNGTNALTWNLACSAPWLDLSPGTGGSLTPGGPSANVKVSLDASASNEMVGVYNATVWFTNTSDHVVQRRDFTLNVVALPSFTSVPTNLSVVAGFTAEFTGAATGGLPLAYQWQFNGTNLADGALISGATSAALTLAHVSTNSAGSYTLTASNYAGVVTSAPPAVLNVIPSPELVQNGGFELGNFTFWTESGNFTGTTVSTGSAYAHSGEYGAKLGPGGSLGYLSQDLPTSPCQLYLVSLWLDSPNGETPNEFLVSWDSTNLFDEVDVPEIGWTNLQFEVTASSTNTVLKIGFRDDPAYLGLDDVSVLPLIPQLRDVATSGGTVSFDWLAVLGFTYQVQYSTNLMETNWVNLGGSVTATNMQMLVSDAVNTNCARFYRVVLVQ